MIMGCLILEVMTCPIFDGLAITAASGLATLDELGWKGLGVRRCGGCMNYSAIRVAAASMLLA
jgi:hypothetical protein